MPIGCTADIPATVDDGNAGAASGSARLKRPTRAGVNDDASVSRRETVRLLVLGPVDAVEGLLRVVRDASMPTLNRTLTPQGVQPRQRVRQPVQSTHSATVP